MKYLNIENSQIPVLGFGTWRLEGFECSSMVNLALDIGYRHIDTAQAYGNEEAVGIGLKNNSVKREDIFLTTKIDSLTLAPKNILSSFEESLKKLQTDYVDLLLIHWPNPKYDLRETLDVLQKIKSENKAKHIGVSNFTCALMEEAQAITDGNVVCNQVEYHPLLSQKSVIKTAKDKNIFLTAYCPLARGAVFKNELLNDLAKKYNKSVAQISLRWLIQQDNICAVPKTATLANARANFDIFDFEIEDDDMSKIFTIGTPAGRIVNKDFAPKWDLD